MSDHIILSEEQTAIANHIAEGRGNLQVCARAGCGKTTLCLEVIPLMRGSVAYVVFNTKNAAEARDKFAARGIKAQVGTFHSFGNRAITRAYPKSKLEGKGAGNAGYDKFDRIVQELQVPEYLIGFVKKAMSLAMQSGFGIEGFVKLGDKSAWLELVNHYNIDETLGEDNIGLRLKGREACIQEGCNFAAKAIVLGTKIIGEVY